MNCPDCLDQDRRRATCVYDLKQQGMVCPRCERVFSPLIGHNTRHYASERACKTRMMRDKKAGQMNASTNALVDRILRGN